MSEVYNVDYFINFFEAIPEEKWITGSLNFKGKCCALGHLNVISDVEEGWIFTPEAEALDKIFKECFIEEGCFDSISLFPGRATYFINDNSSWAPFYVECRDLSPKQRVLKYLNIIKEKQNGNN